MLTELPDWPGLTHSCTVHARSLEDLEDPGTEDAVDAGLRRLERENPGKAYKEIGRHYCQRMDIHNSPWQLFIGLTEVIS